MKILADENVAHVIVVRLREHGHDVVWIREDSPGVSDDEVLTRSGAEKRLLITFDKDFGELVWRHGLAAPCGVILFRFSMDTPDLLAQKVVAIIESSTDWAGQFSVVDDQKIRLISMPEPPFPPL